MGSTGQAHVVVQGDQMTITVEGMLTADLVVDVVQTRYPSFRGRRLLWDLSAVEVGPFTDEDFLRIATIVREHTPPNVERKTAYVVGSQAAFVMLWKYLNKGIMVHVPVEYRTFTDLAAAQQWLGQF
jgi:hypothetical protein